MLSKRCRYGKAFDVVDDTEVRTLLRYGRRTLLIRGGTNYQKLGGRKISGAKICAAAPTISVCPTYWGHMPFMASS